MIVLNVPNVKLVLANKSRGLTQSQVADEAGVVEIWGCANSTY